MAVRGGAWWILTFVSFACSEAVQTAPPEGASGSASVVVVNRASADALEEALPRLGACAESPLLVPTEFGGVEPDLVVEGTVVALGSGVPGEVEGGRCPFFGNNLGFADGHQSSDNVPELAQISWIRVADAAGVETLLAVLASGFAFPSGVGDELTFELHAELLAFSPTRNWLEVRRTDGSLLIWIGAAGGVAELNTPAELTLALGPIEEERTAQCVTSWTENQLEATVGDMSAVIPHRAQAMLGELLVTNGEVLIQTGPSMCPDAFVASAQAAAWPVEASVPLTGGIGGPCDAALIDAPFLQVDSNLSCLRDTRFPLGYLTLACGSAIECPAQSFCDGSLCRAPCVDDTDCPRPTECLAMGDVDVCQCGPGCVEALCANGSCAANCPDAAELGVHYFTTDHAACVDNQETCPAGLERFDVIGCGCGCRLAPGSSCAGPPTGASYTRALGGCTPSCAAEELPFSELCGCGCAPTSDPAALCLPPSPLAAAAYLPEPGCEANCGDATRAFSDACGCVCADATAAREICLLPVESGPCLVETPRYYYEPLDDVCTPFTYGGCLGNLNNYPTLEACEAACVPFP